MQNIHRRHVFLSLIILAIGSCSKQPTDYRSFLDSEEKVYPGLVSNLEIKPGNNRLLLTWVPNTDPNVTRYAVYWNNGADSTIINANPGASKDTVKTYINNLDEATYNFVVHSFDAKGDRSIPINIDNAKVYGNNYRGSLLNRAVSLINYADNKVTITWNVPDTINVITEIQYTNISNEIKTLYLPADSNRLVIADWKLPTSISYRSSYKPQGNAIDTFKVSAVSIMNVPNLPVDKSSWLPSPLANDVTGTAVGTMLQNIWDGAPGSYPNIYQTTSDTTPHTFTVDLGKTYRRLTKFAEWGRSDISALTNGNPVDIEVWGIEDTTGRATILPATNTGWKDESIAKGWTLLTQVKRADNGVAAVNADLVSNPPPVRFIRLRILATVAKTKFSHMSEISFWYTP